MTRQKLCVKSFAYICHLRLPSIWTAGTVTATKTNCLKDSATCLGGRSYQRAENQCVLLQRPKTTWFKGKYSRSIQLHYHSKTWYYYHKGKQIHYFLRTLLDLNHLTEAHLHRQGCPDCPVRRENTPEDNFCISCSLGQPYLYDTGPRELVMPEGKKLTRVPQDKTACLIIKSLG